MSLNVGGLYVRVQKGITQKIVVDAITAYWTKLGARALAGDPLSLDPLSLEKTGKLGFLVGKPASKWIAIYDSERYRADPALARHLSVELSTAVAHYEMHGATDHAYYNAYGDGPKCAKKSWDDVEEFVATTFPYAFLYFNKLEKGDAGDFAVFGFEGIPPRPKAQYTGPSKGVLSKEQRLEEAKRLGAANDIAGLRALLDKYPHVKSAVRDVVKYAKDPELVVEFAGECATDPWTNREVGTAAVKLRDWKLFKRAFDSARKDENFVLWEGGAWDLYQAGDIEGAHAIYSAIVECTNPSLSAWNNYVGTLRGKLSAAVRKKLAVAEKLGPKNPSIYHNLACAWMREGDVDHACAAISDAIRYGYDGVEKMRADEDFKAIRKDKRFVAAFTVDVKTFDFAELDTTMSIYRKKRVVMRPVIGLFYFCKWSAGLPGLFADLLEPFAAKATWYQHGHWKKLDGPNAKRQLTKLRKLPKTYFSTFAWRDTDGDATDFCVEAWITPVADESCGFSLTLPRDTDPEDAYARFVEIAAKLPYEAGGCGYFLQTRDSCSVYEGVSYDGDSARETIAGFESYYSRRYSPGTVAPHWITLVGDKLLAKVGGEAKLGKAIGTAKLARVGGGVAIRAAKRPPIAQVTAPNDVGALPSVALALKPLRDDGDRHARFDAIAPTSYDNEG